ncbi:hypothetical protein BB560_000981 [Smittium megazygosporum]|uniref:Uncharacterized protein n=1 Tax=Smittium megazygosporum TaxID=133381 RepID=A0A2T9ZJ35_9FUNG|nr:hypothetical protein BB560_000981 [Smittium megazygosporum]
MTISRNKYVDDFILDNFCFVANTGNGLSIQEMFIKENSSEGVVYCFQNDLETSNLHIIKANALYEKK